MMKNNMIIYVSKDGNVKVDVNIQNEDIWMSQDVMANLYDTTKNNISMHLKNIFDEGELEKNSVVKKFLTTASDGKKYNVLHYNLDAIIAVGYRINSKKATEFRIWATKVLKEYMIKGFALNDERLKNNGESPYFEELLARIRDIRSLKKYFGEKCWIFMQLQLIMIPKINYQLISLKQCKIKCIMLHMDILLLKLYLLEWILKKNI